MPTDSSVDIKPSRRGKNSIKCTTGPVRLSKVGSNKGSMTKVGLTPNARLNMRKES